MNNKVRALLITAGVSAIGYALYRFYQVQVNFIKNIDYKIQEIKVRNVDIRNLTMDITFRVWNYSNIEATVKELFLDFYVNGVQVGNIQEAKDIVIYPAKFSDVSFTFNLELQKAFKNILNIVSLTASLKDVKFQAVGYVKIKSSFITKTAPFDYETTFKEIMS